MDAPPALDLRDLRFGFPGGFQLSLPRLTLAAGEEIALCGASGSGKSTLLQLVAGLLEPDAGSIRIGGEEITRLRGAARDRFRGRRIGFVFQTLQLAGGFTARENVCLAAHFADAGRDELGGVRPSERAAELLGSLGLDEIDRPVETYSLGQQQRIAVARAIVCRPSLVLADEPTASLDPDHAARTVDLIRETCRAAGAGLLLVTHDPAIAGRFRRVERLEALAATAEASA